MHLRPVVWTVLLFCLFLPICWSSKTLLTPCLQSSFLICFFSDLDHDLSLRSLWSRWQCLIEFTVGLSGIYMFASGLVEYFFIQYNSHRWLMAFLLSIPMEVKACLFSSAFLLLGLCIGACLLFPQLSTGIALVDMDLWTSVHIHVPQDSSTSLDAACIFLLSSHKFSFMRPFSPVSHKCLWTGFHSPRKYLSFLSFDLHITQFLAWCLILTGWKKKIWI